MKLLGEIVFYTLLMLLPVNLGQHFFSHSAYIHGVLVDYYLPTLYLTDLLVIFLLLTWVGEGGIRGIFLVILNLFQNLREMPKRVRHDVGELLREPPSLALYIFIALFLFLVWAGLSLLWAPLKDVALYRYARLLEGALFAFWVGRHVNLRRDFGKISTALFLGVSYESLLAIGQWFTGGSLFGYYFLGEQPYNALTSGIARTGFLGEVRVRAYGTFTHPNVLGAYLALFLPWLFWRIVNKRATYSALGLLVLTLSALFFTFSRAAWLAAAAGLLFLVVVFKREHLRLTGKGWLGLLGGVFLLAGFLFSNTFNDPFSLARRQELNQLALRMVKDSPLLGVGWGNFMVRLDDFGRVSGWTRFLQPVHNVFLLVAAETGLVGFTFWSLFFFLLLFALLKFWRFSRLKFCSPPIVGPASATLQLLLTQNGQESYRLVGLLFTNLLQITFLGLSDHYFLTLPQGGLLFWLAVGLVFSLASA